MISEKDMMHGVDYRGEDVSGWLMSEKHNGCRAYWDGSTMWTRGGKVINIPESWIPLLPDFPVEGEIHAGRGGFQTARLAVQYGRFTDECRFGVFDTPHVPAGFSDRYAMLLNLLPLSGAVHLVYHLDCPEISSAVDYMRDIQAKGGEGVMLRHPENRYVAGRSSQVLKLKVDPAAGNGVAND